MSERSTNPKDILASSKAPLEFVPMSMVIYAAMQMKNGAAKYGSYNFRGTGVRASVYYAGALRHLVDFFNGNEFDEEGVPNMAGLCANVAILADAYAHGYLVDDRPPKVDMRALLEQAEAEAKATNERHKDRPEPKHYTIMDSTFKAEGAPRVVTQDRPLMGEWPDELPRRKVVPEYFEVSAPDRPAVDTHDSKPVSRYPQELLDAAELDRSLPAGVRFADGP